MIAMDKSREPWRGDTGYIDQGMLAKHLPDLASPMYYLAGPPAMVAALRELLNGSGHRRRRYSQRGVRRLLGLLD